MIRGAVALVVAALLATTVVPIPEADVALGGFPTQVIYEAAFGYGANDPAPVWTDISAYVEDAEWETGQAPDSTTIESGKARLSLNNRDGRFSAWNTASPYWAGGLGLVPMTPLRIRSIYSATTYSEWRGFVLAWPARRLGTSESVVTISSADRSALFAASQRLPSVWESVMAGMAPTSWWRLGEQSGTTMVDSSGNGNHGTYEGGATFNTRAGLIANSADNAILFDSIGQQGVVSLADHPAAAITSFPFAIAGWFIIPAANQGRVMWAQRRESGGNSYMTVQASGTGGLADSIFTGIVDAAGTNKRTWQSANTFADNLPHFLVVNWYADGSIDMWVDNVYQTVSLFSTAGAAPGIQSPTGIQYVAPSSSLDATFDEVATFNGRHLISTDVAALYAAGKTPWTGDTTGTRIGRLLDLYGVPAGERAIDAGQSTVIDADIEGKTLMEAIQEIVTAEDGRFFVGPDGTVTFHDRHHVLKSPYTVSQATFGDGGGSEIPYEAGLEVTNEIGDIYNEVPVSRKGGTVVIYTDSASAGRYGYRTLTGRTSLIISSDAELPDRANWELAHRARPVNRVRSLPLRSSTATATTLPQQLARKLRDRVTIKEHGPGASATTFSQDFLIEHIRKRVSPGLYETEWALSAADTQPYMVLDASTATLDTARLGY